MEERRFGTSTAEDPGEDLHRRRTTAGSRHRRKRIKEWIFICRGSRRASSSTDGGREIREINSGGSGRRSASVDSHGSINSSTRKDRGMDLYRQRIQESFYIDRPRKGRSSTSSPGSNELENGRKSDELKERLEIERTRERSETGRTR